MQVERAQGCLLGQLGVKRGVVLTLHSFALELLFDCCCSPHQFRIVAHPLSGLADGRTALLKSPEKVLPAPVTRKKPPSDGFPDW